MKKTFRTTLVRDGSICFIPVPFDPRPVFGKVSVPVKVTLNGYTYRSTIASMGDGPCIPLRRSHREGAGVGGDETLNVTLVLDTDKREIKPPADLRKALKAAPRPGTGGVSSAIPTSASTSRRSKARSRWRPARAASRRRWP